MPCCRRTADASKRLVLKVLASRDQSPSAALEEDFDDGDGDDADEDDDWHHDHYYCYPFSDHRCYFVSVGDRLLSFFASLLLLPVAVAATVTLDYMHTATASTTATHGTVSLLPTSPRKQDSPNVNASQCCDAG